MHLVIDDGVDYSFPEEGFILKAIKCTKELFCHWHSYGCFCHRYLPATLVVAVYRAAELG